MAEVILKKELKIRKRKGFTVGSAGLCVTETEMNPFSLRVLTENGYRPSAKFKPKKLTKRNLDSCAIVITMTQEQANRIGGNKVISMEELTGISIPDPYGKPIEHYRYCFDLLRIAMPKVVEKIFLFFPAEG